MKVFYLLILALFSSVVLSEMVITGSLSTNIDEADYKCLLLMGKKYKLCYRFIEADTQVDIYLNVNTTGYIGIGVTNTLNDPMKNSDIVMASSTDKKGGSGFTVTDCYAFGTDSPKLDTKIKGTDDILAWGVSRDQSQNKIIARYIRKCNTGDKYDSVIDKTSILNFIIAISNKYSSGSHHTEAHMVRIDMARGVIVPISDSILWLHGSLMFAGFAILLTSAAFIARFVPKKNETWFIVHIILASLGTVSILVGFAMSFFVPKTVDRGIGPHHIIGYIMPAAILFQIALGVYIDRIWRAAFAKNKVAPLVNWKDKLHWFVGRGIILLAYLNIVLGIFFLDTVLIFLILFFVFLVLLVGAFFLLEYFKQKRPLAEYNHHVFVDVDTSFDLEKMREEDYD